MQEKHNLVGKRFGRLTVVSWSGRDRGNNAWNCVCDCGNHIIARSSPLGAGGVKSCGCLARETKSSFRHGMAGKGKKKSPTYSSWSHMKSRCQDEKHDRFKDFGGRGITICEEWNDFCKFLSDMGERPKGTTLGRINKAQGYSPSNCKWMTSEELSKGKRKLPPYSEQNRQPLPAHCEKGHLYPPPNIGGTRHCKTCAKSKNEELEPARRIKALELKREVIAAYGGRCACCGEDRIEFLAIDHIFNDGAEDRRSNGKSGGQFYRRLKRDGFPQGRLQVLCYNCNGAKGYYGYCPHTVEAQKLFGLEIVRIPVIRTRLTPEQKYKPETVKSSRRRKISKEKADEIALRYLDGNITMEKLSKEYGVGISMVHRSVHDMSSPVSSSGASV